MNDDIMQKLAQVAPRHYKFLVKTAGEVNVSPFRTEVIDEMDTLIKKAMNWGAAKGGLRSGAGAIGRGAMTLGGAVGAAAVGGIALALAGDLYDAAKRGITKGRDYTAMMQANPHLQKMPAKEVQKAFSVLHRFNPEFAGDPTVSGAWVGRQVNVTSMQPDEYANLNTLKPLIDARKNLADTKKIAPFKLDKRDRNDMPTHDDLRSAMGMRNTGSKGGRGPAGPAGPMGPAGANIEMYPAPEGGWRSSPPR